MAVPLFIQKSRTMHSQTKIYFITLVHSIPGQNLCVNSDHIYLMQCLIPAIIQLLHKAGLYTRNTSTLEVHSSQTQSFFRILYLEATSWRTFLSLFCQLSYLLDSFISNRYVTHRQLPLAIATQQLFNL